MSKTVVLVLCVVAITFVVSKAKTYVQTHIQTPIERSLKI